MTAAMRRMHAVLPLREQYPAPPHEIVERAVPTGDSQGAIRDLTLLGHFLYGGLCGAAFTALPARHSAAAGAVYGIAVWVASYFGWIPAAGILRSATDHPLRRNLMMIVAHAVWGATSAFACKELDAAKESIFRAGPVKDK